MTERKASIIASPSPSRFSPKRAGSAILRSVELALFPQNYIGPELAVAVALVALGPEVAVTCTER